jgi:hypothetical protein
MCLGLSQGEAEKNPFLPWPSPCSSVRPRENRRTQQQMNQFSCNFMVDNFIKFYLHIEVLAKSRIRTIFLIGIVGGWVQLGPLGTAATNRPTVPAKDDYVDGEIGGMIGGGNRSIRRKPASMPLCPPHTPHAARTRTRAAAVGRQRLTAWATAWPYVNNLHENLHFFAHLERNSCVIR